MKKELILILYLKIVGLVKINNYFTLLIYVFVLDLDLLGCFIFVILLFL